MEIEKHPQRRGDIDCVTVVDHMAYASNTKREDLYTLGSLLATLFTIVASPLETNYKGLQWYLLAASAALLLVIGTVRFFDSTGRNMWIVVPLASAVFLVCPTALGIAAWGRLHPPISASRMKQEPPSAAQRPAEAGSKPERDSQDTYTLTTSGNNSPIVVGTGNTVTRGNSNERGQAKKKPLE
jgi:hypothetical protein